MNNRLYKIQDLLHKEIANLILKEIKNPLLNKSITISGVRVSKDIRYADIFFTTFESDTLKVEKELNKSSSFIKNELSKKLYIKRLPNLKFIYDKTADSSEKIENIIKTLPKGL
tara:strand:- start:18220 stop:18561 length:342 start_codon:yes stop_codon:yes gene_type:complete